MGISRWALAACAASILLVAAAHQAAHAVEEAQAAKGPAFKIPVLISSRTDTCYDSGDVAAIKHMALNEQDRINRRGGVSGRPIQVEFLDDARDAQKTIAATSPLS